MSSAAHTLDPTHSAYSIDSNSLPFATFVLAKDTTITGLNSIAEQLFSASHDNIINSPIAAWIAPQDDILRFITDSIEHGSSTKAYTHELQLADERIIRAHIYVMAQPDDTIHITIDMMSGDDSITQQQQRDAVTERAGLMAAMLAHEIKNPLSAIRGASQLLQDDVKDSEDSASLVSLVINEVDRINHTLSRIEFLTDNRPLTREPLNIHEILIYVMEVLDPTLTKHIAFSEQFDPSLPKVAGDRESLIQLFLNIVKNSAEALSESLNNNDKSPLIIRTRYVQRYDMRYRQKTPLPICISIEDGAGGIPEAIAENLFDPLTSTKSDGHGLGLAIAAKITRDHGGIIELSENSETRTVFSVLLPIAE